MKVHISLQLKPGPYGGSHQFLKSLRRYFVNLGIYVSNPKHADVILFDSFQNILNTAKLKINYKDKIFVHRIDGPIRLYNRMNDFREFIVYISNELMADGTIFQSKWSRLQNRKLGLKKNKFETIIMNAPDPGIFNKEGKIPFSENRKIKLIATSWSSNWNKGFDVYKWLDENLDFSRYEMTFIGNSPIRFKNIHWIKPLPPKELAQQLKMHDIYITASRNDPCSNALLEALHTGLPAIARNSGGHPEIIKKGGELFDHPEEIPELIERIVSKYEKYVSRIDVPTLEGVARKYYQFMSNIYKKVQEGDYTPKTLSKHGYLKMKSIIYYWKIKENTLRLKRR